MDLFEGLLLISRNCKETLLLYFDLICKGRQVERKIEEWNKQG